MTAGDGEEGFALVEALVAFAILALATIAMFHAFADATVTLRRAEQAQAELDVAQNVVASALGRPDSSIASSGRMNGIDWTLSVEPLSGRASGPRRLSVTVGRDRGPVLETIDLGPRR